ncbi:MAG: hypothetical protein ACRDIU_07690, partial [Actinomycetota bacterium]
MSFAADDFRDLVQLLEEHPEWRAELRRLVLTDELLDLPAAIQHLSERIEALAEAQQRTEQQIEALAGRTDTLASGMDRLTASMDQLVKLV